MKKILSILLVSLAALSNYAQTEAGFLKDAKNNFVRVGISSTELKWSPFPPDTIIDFSVNVGGVGEPFTSLLTEIKSYWTLEEAAGNAIDSVGTADLPIFGTVTREETGVLGDCYSFVTDAYLGDIDTYYEFTSSFTVACWMNTSNVSDGGMGLITNEGTANRGWELITWGSGGDATARMYIRGGWGTVQSVSTTFVNDGYWHHIVGSYNADDDSLKVYVDGVREDRDYSVNGPVYDDGCRLHIGSRTGQYYYDGLIDEPAIWNKELTQAEVDSLFIEVQYPFLGAGSGGDSLRMLNNGFDPRGDSVRVLWKYTGWPANRTDGTLQFAFNMADSADYKDTTFVWGGLGDTIVYYAAFTGTDDVWTVVPNKDTVLIDSSDIDPPPQDYPAIWDTIFYFDFEDNSAPSHYDLTAFLADGWTSVYQNGYDNFRASDHRGPGYWIGNVPDSIVVDPQTNSKVLKLNFDDAFEDGYCGNFGRGGDSWKMELDAVYTEVYLSYNVMLRPGWDFSVGGGKFSPGIMGGTDSGHQEPQEYGDGFRLSAIAWDYGASSPDNKGNLAYYLYHQDQPNTYGEFLPFMEFQPTGGGLTGHYNDEGKFIYPTTDSTWYNITIRCVTNTHTGTTNNKDGILEAFINGQLVERETGLSLITYPDIGNEINKLFFFHAMGSGCPANDEWTFFDDICMFTYDVGVDVPRGNELSSPGRVLSLPNWPKPVQE